MKKLMIGLVAAALLPLSVPVQAKTVCLSLFSGFAQMKISIKPIKKPGTFSAITGFYQENGGLNGAVEGSAMVQADGTVNLGLNLHSMLSTVINREIILSAKGLDTALQGAYHFDNNGDGASDGSTTATVMNCKDVVLLGTP